MDTLVDKIVRGQAKVDQMKAEIKTVTGALWGWLRKNHPTNDIEWFVIPCGSEKFGRRDETYRTDTTGFLDRGGYNVDPAVF